MNRRALAAAVLLAAASSAGCHKESITQPTLSADCEARPSSGLAPLAVSFALSVAGASGPFTVVISYGDGTSGSDPDLPHTYAAAGSYTASFTVATASQSARCAATVAVAAGPAPPPSGNRHPVAVFKTTPAPVGSKISDTAPLSVRFNLCASSDPDGDDLYFLMDFDGDGRFDSGGTTGASCRQDHTYPVGTWNPEVCLHDMGPDRVALHDDQCETYVVVAAP